MEIESSEKRSRSPSENESPQATKKPREDTMEPQIHVTENIFRSVRNAFDLKRAIESAKKKTKPIGFSVAKFETDTLLRQKVKKPLKALRKLHDYWSSPYHNGYFDSSFHLTITRPGCEFDGHMSKNQHDLDACLAIVPELYKHADTSPFGDLQALETRVDPDVRDAREIPANQFTVDPDLLNKVRTMWARYFIPDDVRVEPYKIHLYGPGGHFKSHRDTPEPGLVGTFLVGLGDTICPEQKTNGGKFHIEGTSYFAETCSWVAFYPDVPHHISKLAESQYRGVIAFKIFKTDYEVQHEEAVREFDEEERVRSVLAELPVPYGLLLRHKYYMGASQLTGIDPIIVAAARKLSGVQVHLLPVVIPTFAYISFVEPEETKRQAFVHPFTSAHVDYILGKGKDPSLIETSWLKRLGKAIPFFSIGSFEGSAKEWKKEYEEEHYTGNESDATRETSIYVSFALVCLSDDHPDSGPPGGDEIESSGSESLGDGYLSLSTSEGSKDADDSDSDE